MLTVAWRGLIRVTRARTVEDTLGSGAEVTDERATEIIGLLDGDVCVVTVTSPAIEDAIWVSFW